MPEMLDQTDDGVRVLASARRGKQHMLRPDADANVLSRRERQGAQREGKAALGLES